MTDRRIALYPGSFDPITNGHMDIIERALAVFDRLVVGIGANLDKEPLFSVDERIEMVRRSIGEREDVEIMSYEGLTANFADKIGAVAIVRGLRAISDFEYEFQMALANHELFPQAETVFLMPRLENVYLSSMMVKTIANLDGDVSRFVPQPVKERLEKKLKP